MASHDQVARLLVLVPYLQQHPGIPVTEAAAAFGITPKQLRADLNIAWMCGLPGGLPGDLIEIDMDAVDGEGTIVLTNAEYLARPMRFTLDEALSLVLALRALRDLVGTELRPAVDSALAIFEGLASSSEADRVAVDVSGGAEDVRSLVSTAITEGRRLRLTYDGVARGETTRPLVDPLRVAVRDGYAYLDGWSFDRGAWRTYRLDRIAAAEVLTTPSEPHDGAPDASGGWLDRLSAAALVTLVVAPEYAWIAEYYPAASVARRDDGVEVSFHVADPAWLRGLLLRLGDGLVSLTPDDAAAGARTAAREALALYERVGSTP